MGDGRLALAFILFIIGSLFSCVSILICCSVICAVLSTKSYDIFGSSNFKLCKLMSLEAYIDIDGQGVDCGPDPDGAMLPNDTECDLNEECASGWCHDPSNVYLDVLLAFGLFSPDKICQDRPTDP
tara:strand:+ start:402 stop:779 length:378 start_codon:yes stop_codon:yes gene_type:complete